jgi:RNA recognition motif-containing protein
VQGMRRLPSAITSERLKEWMEENSIEGPIEVNIIRDKITEEPKGVGFVTVETTQSEAVLALNGSQLDDKVFNIKVDDKPAEKKEKVSRKRCYRCGGDHEPSQCTSDRVCYKCGSSDHISSNCSRKKMRTGEN